MRQVGTSKANVRKPTRLVHRESLPVEKTFSLRSADLRNVTAFFVDVSLVICALILVYCFYYYVKATPQAFACRGGIVVLY